MRKSAKPSKATPAPPAPPAPRSSRVKVSLTINRKLLHAADTIARETGRNRSEMMDRTIEHYIATHPEGRLAK